MSKSKCYLGVDVGAKEVWVAVTGRKPRSFKHTRQGIRALHAWAGKLSSGGILHFCMESTGVYSKSLAAQLLSYAETEVSLINPAQIKAFARATLRRTKTDSVDARVILEFALSQQPPAWLPESQSLEHLYQLVAQADDIRDNIRQWENRGHAYGYIADLPKVTKQVQRQILRTLNQQLAKIEKAITALCQTDEQLQAQVDLLCTIPGIRQLSAVRLLAYGKSALTDRSQKALTAHAGLAPGHRQSGTSIRGKSHISKQGNKQIRRTLYMPALCGIVHNPILCRYYQQLLKKGKLEMVALTACMRKLLLIVRAMLLNQMPFNPEINP